MAEASALFAAQAWAWAGLDTPPLGWAPAAELLFPCFDRGLLSNLRLNAAVLPALAELRRLFAVEPVTEVRFDVTHVPPGAATAARTLLPFPRPVRVTVVRAGSDRGEQDAFLAALLSSPVMASATELTLDGLHPGRAGSRLVCWLTESSFLYNVRSLRLSQNGLTCPAARALSGAPGLRRVAHLDVTNNRIGDAGRAALTARFGDGLVV